MESTETSLLTQLQKLELKLELFNQEDSAFGNGIPEPAELGTRSWEQDIRSTRNTIKQELYLLMGKTRGALTKIKQGIYGKCESCGSQIEENRLKIMPIAEVCLSCAKI